MVKKFNKPLKRGLIALFALIAILLTANTIVISVFGNRLEKRIEAIRAAGDPVSLPDLAPDAVLAKQNAAVFLRRAKGDVEAVTKVLQPVFHKDGFHAGILGETDLKLIKLVFKARPNVIPLLQRAAECPDYDPQLDYTVTLQVFIDDSLSRVHNSTPVFRLLAAHVHLHVSQGEREEALRTCLLIFRLSRHSGREPAILGHLGSLVSRNIGINAANAVLRSGPLSKSSHKALDAELALHDDIASFIWALKTERVMGMEHYQSTSHREGAWPKRAIFLEDQREYLDIIREQLDFASRPYSALVAAGLKNKYQGKTRGVSHASFPKILQCRVASDLARARIRCLRVLNALHRRADQGDHSELKLAELGLAPDVTTDPFTGQPLRVKKTSKDWLVYSVGENLQDDGGKLSSKGDVGVGPKRFSRLEK